MERICDRSSGGSHPVSGQGEEIKLVRSNVEKQIQRAAGSRSGGPFESQAVPSDDRQQREFTGHLNTYYNEVISCIRDAEFILIYGPGEAKGDFSEYRNSKMVQWAKRFWIYQPR